eukprot:scaffold207_cov409-Prasinococcus_capsulatus_cf.AAC.90
MHASSSFSPASATGAHATRSGVSCSLRRLRASRTRGSERGSPVSKPTGDGHGCFPDPPRRGGLSGAVRRVPKGPFGAWKGPEWGPAWPLRGRPAAARTRAVRYSAPWPGRPPSRIDEDQRGLTKAPSPLRMGDRGEKTKTRAFPSAPRRRAPHARAPRFRRGFSNGPSRGAGRGGAWGGRLSLAEGATSGAQNAPPEAPFAPPEAPFGGPRGRGARRLL